MKPKGREQGQYLMLLNGLEDMARMYKDKKESRTTRLGAVLSLLRQRGGLREFFRRGTGRIAYTLFTQWQNVSEPGETHAQPRADEVRRYGESYFSETRIAVYMAMFGGYDHVMEPLIQPDNVEYFIITDGQMPDGSRWHVIDPKDVLPPELIGDPIRSNRWCKMHPHLLFPGFEESVYVDSNYLVVSDLTPLTATLKDYPVAMFLHEKRQCVYDEVKVCRLVKRDTAEALNRHERLLREHGVPEHYGLLEAPIIARRHNDPVCVDLMEAWWDAFIHASRRDQISLIDVLWQQQIPVSRLGTLGEDFRQCDLLIAMRHAVAPYRKSL